MKTFLATSLLFAACAANATTPIDETRPLDASAKVSLENVRGRIRVDTWDRPEIHIGGYLGDNVKELEIEGDADDLRVKVKNPQSSGWFGGSGDGGDSELLVTLPSGVALSVDAVSADVEVRGVNGRSLDIDSVSGDVVVETGAQDVDIDLVSGSVKISAQSRSVEIESVSGDIELRGAVSDKISVESVSGDLSVDSSASLNSVTAGVVSGDIDLRTPLQNGAHLNAESLSGDLTLTLPKSTSARLKASSFTGDLTSDAGNVEKPEHGPGSNLDTVLGGGSGEIVLETFSGDLTIRLK